MRLWRQYGLILICLLLLPTEGMAAEMSIDHKRQYRSCITLTYREPWKAFDAAEAWAALNGGAAARHCAALALLEAKQFDRAAQRLEALASALPPEHSPSPGDVMAQAANVWLLGGRLELALQAIDLALQYHPDNPSHLIDRARISAEQGSHAAALADLDRAVVLLPDDDDAAAFRASALRQLNRPEEAMRAINRALAINPNNPSARLERGILRYSQGDLTGARADWLRAAQDHGGTPAGDAAQARLQQMELNRN
ncbi:MAG: tetratricopeptide repeat protein [Rhodospirillaceae bacterium]|jgi:tetratricopeptide (TPR) repeat protein|nr:tetratricopeptide repeat protein [Rhodospirillaceae bacterium]MBT5191981.1 tetratricopeptide repeat protein [Rhodospirillaceae bacterium]MBT6427214.1 tetratricopeptide repeat protein [Rhodospirillaceae bacterium]